ncbi:ABC transporter permease [Pokkaliibacter sp. MBI-7]|uniref:ABC transporter permease n=1 Tax=Pokkaliibacter sp. MBI-7 TaxID=3040600 RepID=UPI00244C1A08|nr:ABC transporter permease [Pokkaliibacter sp. MBI-7]MDH2432320.1 ABC transporter permease [Pokkaliibacter sp. MBI-7]
MTTASTRQWPVALLLSVSLLLLVTLSLPHWQGLFHWLQPDSKQVIYNRDGFFTLLGSHLLLVLSSGLAASLTGIGLGLWVTRDSGRDFLPLVSTLASVGQTFPPVAVLALAVPALGFGFKPAFFSLLLYGLLPVVRNTIAGIQGIAPAVQEAAQAMGMTPWQQLWQVELPMAASVILAGVRTSLIINVATATIGSTIGARTLGDPIIAGLINFNLAYVVQGALLVGLLAISLDSLFDYLGRRLYSAAARP